MTPLNAFIVGVIVGGVPAAIYAHVYALDSAVEMYREEIAALRRIVRRYVDAS